MKRVQNKIQDKGAAGNSNIGNNFLEGNGKRQHPLQNPLPGTPSTSSQLQVGKALESSALPANHSTNPGKSQISSGPKGRCTQSRWCSLLSASRASVIRNEKREKFGFSRAFLYQPRLATPPMPSLGFHEFWTIYSQRSQLCTALITSARETQPWTLHRSPLAPNTHDGDI